MYRAVIGLLVVVLAFDLTFSRPLRASRVLALLTKIGFDRFHVAKHLGDVSVGDAVDRVRRREHRALRTEGDATLTKTKYLWLTSKTRLAWAERRQLAALSRVDLSGLPQQPNSYIP